MKISVAMAYYNGKTYINEQLESILCQLGPEDEVSISVDGAEDGSYELVDQWAMRDDRIVLIRGPHQGVVRNFEHAIEQCSGDVIFLSDQDDIWEAHKVKKVMWAFERSGALVVLHNAVLVDAGGHANGEPELFALRKSNTGVLKNFVQNSYVGCCMAFKKELIPVILPIPDHMYMHDYWIGTAGEYMGKVVLLKEPLIRYRRHGDNVTRMHHGSAGFMIKKRLNILPCLRELKKRKRMADHWAEHDTQGGAPIEDGNH